MATEAERDLRVEGLSELVKVLGKIPRALEDEFRDVTLKIAEDLAEGARNAASTPLQSLAAEGIRVDRDNPPAVVVGGTMVRPGVDATDIWYGAEYGGGSKPTTRHFPDHRGQRGYFLTPVASQRGQTYNQWYAEALDKAMADWDHKE